MDLHPLVIHYPIAFLTTYVVFELVRIRKILALPYWFHIKMTLVVIGELGAIATVITAQFSTELRGGNMLVDRYKLFIIITALIFGMLAFAYVFKFTDPNSDQSGQSRALTTWFHFILKPFVLIPLVITGLFFIIVSGGLFGATIYGTHFDPFLAPIFKLLKVY
ncbi:MAG: hypothetical protein HYX23_00960 [Candidatus Zambryskibacteria bacterium]|nr:hypothetical protein [Candidatus Zambryskibacteria bacterium]